MNDMISRVMDRVRTIQALIGEAPATNREFGRVLHRTLSVAEVAREAPESPLAEGVTRSGRRRDLAPLVAEAARETGLPEQLISAVIAAESGYRPDAVSPAGALGLMQLMPGTARSLGVDDPLDPRQNVRGGAEYLRRQYHRFGSLEKALAAYNAGPGAVERHGGVPPFRETQNYVRRVLSLFRRGMDHRG